MTSSAQMIIPDIRSPVRLRTGVFWSLYGVWYRHVRVYCRTLLANAIPPVLEPIFFFAAVALGLGAYIPGGGFDGLSYTTYVASGVLVSSAMWTGVFETTYNTFVRLVYQHTYDAMLGTHLRPNEIFIGEMLFSATKGAVFASVVVLVTLPFGAQPTWWCLLVPVVGFVTGYLWAAIGLIVTSYVKMINNFTFFTTGVITPVFFFSGTFFPVLGHYNRVVDAIATAVPLTASIELSRALFKARFTEWNALHIGVLAAYLVVCHVLALRRMRKRVLG